jgi:hypothetical protein
MFCPVEKSWGDHVFSIKIKSHDLSGNYVKVSYSVMFSALLRNDHNRDILND